MKTKITVLTRVSLGWWKFAEVKSQIIELEQSAKYSNEKFWLIAVTGTIIIHIELFYFVLEVYLSRPTYFTPNLKCALALN